MLIGYILVTFWTMQAEITNMHSTEPGLDRDPDSHSECSEGVNEAQAEIWKDIDRGSYPEVQQRTMPWKPMGLAEVETKPANNGLFGRAWDKIMVSVFMIMDLGSGST